MANATVDYNGGAAAPPAMQGGLALALQEGFTVAARLRGNRQVNTPSNVLRNEMKRLFAQARQRCIRAGYSDEDVTLAVYAFTVFLDETVLQTAGTTLADWARQPLQEELFEGAIGGELFFQYLDGVLARPDTHQTADLLEVFQLCLLLGYRGKYRHAGQGPVARLIDSVSSKIQRIRGDAPHLSPLWRLPENERIPDDLARDPLLPRLAIALGAALLLMLICLVVFKLSRNSGVDEIHREAVESSFVQP